MKDIPDQQHDYELEIRLMVTSWDPVPKTFAVCCRMRLLAMLAMEILEDIRTAAGRQNAAEMHSLFEFFRREYARITSLPSK